MKVYNLTNTSTDALRNAGLLNVRIKVGDVVIPPGGSADVAKGSLADVQRLFVCGALSLEQPEESSPAMAIPAGEAISPPPPPSPTQEDPPEEEADTEPPPPGPERPTEDETPLAKKKKKKRRK